MAAGILNYFGIGSSAPVSEDKGSERALPASWYTSQEIYELERRAIFSRRWLLTTHRARLSQPGDYLRYDIAGFQIVLCRDREGNINGFHNICRHRAYPVVAEEKGCAKIFACKYHGWSYGLNGKLAKAPGYQELEGFDKSQNGLLPIHVHIDANGFIWVNFDGKTTPEVAWHDDFEGADTQERLNEFNFDDYAFDHCWEQEGPYNWKILADNYNETYHNPSVHVSQPTVADSQSFSVNTQGLWIQHDGATIPEQKAAGLTACASYFLPNASFNVSPHFFFIQKFIPYGPTRSATRYEVYRNKNSSDKDFDLVNQIYKRIMSEHKDLCELAQRNINAGIFVNGAIHPRLDKSSLFFQKNVRDIVTTHYRREQAAKQEIWPARQVLPNAAQISKKDIDFCTGLACATSQEGLAW